MRDKVAIAELTTRFANNARSSLPRAPLNAALSAGIAQRPELVRLLLFAPPEQQLPVLLLACVHDLVLRDPGSELAQWYGSVVATPRAADDSRLMKVFSDFVSARNFELEHLLSSRRTQTNEVGRCSFYLLALAEIAPAVGDLAHIDVGASGGLNLLLDNYEYHYEPGGTVGGPSSVVLTTGLRGPAPVPERIPTFGARCGIDIAPIDVTDPAGARWLEACCWPDQVDRFRRLHAAIELAQTQPPELLAGDAVASIFPAVERMAPRGHPVVTNSWVLNYFDAEQRLAYVAELDKAGAERDITWVFLESPMLTPELPWPDGIPDPEHTHLARAEWRDGRRVVERLALCHPHGFWAHWRD